jgi:putative ABC transport system permease protein
VRRSGLIPQAETGGISVLAADPELLATVGGELAAGRFLNQATARYPAVVLGAKAAERLGITATGRQVWLGDRWFTVIGILRPLALAPEIDRAALVGFPAAEALLGSDGSPGTVYVRADPDQVEAVRSVLPATANPANPNEVRVSRPSDALAARAAANTAFTSLLLGLGGVALLVGGVGIANVMVISVLERRSEIGLRRALGATKGHVGLQFLAESLLLALAGGLTGVVLGAAVTTVYAAGRGWSVVVPAPAMAGGILAALAIGAVAGLYPALRAARLAPTDALRTV